MQRVKTDTQKKKDKYLLLKPLLAVILLAGLSIGMLFIVYQHWMNSQFELVEIQHRQNLVQIVSIARNAVEPVLTKVRSGKVRPGEALKHVRALVRTMTYKDQYGNNYVFMSSYDGVMLVQPFEPAKEMTNQWDLTDTHGLFIIRELVGAAKAMPSGSFVKYYYHLPGVHEPQEKLAYVVGIPELQCYIGTGMYMQRAIAGQQENLRKVQYGSILLFIAVLIPVSASMIIILKRNRLLREEIGTRKQIENELKKSEEKYRSIFENAVEGIFQITADGHFISVNPAFARIAGYGSPQEMIDSISSIDTKLLADPEDAKRYRKVLDEKGFIADFEIALKRNDGSPVWISTNSRVVKDEKGKILYYEGTIENITGRKQAEENVRSSRKFLNDILQATSEFSIIATDPTGMITVFNRASERMLGYSSEEVVGRYTPLQMHLESEVSERSRELTAELGCPVEGFRVIAAISEWVGSETREWTYVRKDGSSFPVSLVVTTVYSDRNDITGYLGIATDITKRKQAEEERRELEKQLFQSQKMDAIGQLAGGVAHDFNNMLNVILGYAGLALESMDPAAPVYHDLLEIDRAARRFAGLTHQQLAFSRKQIVEPSVVNLNTLVAQQIKMLSRLIGEDIHIDVRPFAGLWNVYIGPTQIDQILVNLAANARDAIDGVGTITIETANVTVDESFCTHHVDMHPGDYVLLSFSDTGGGMDEETLEYVFEPFFTTKAEGKGTGLGLSTVYGIVKQNGGAIHVYSERNLGTTFKIYLPRLADDREAQMEVIGEALCGGTETILVVEDEEQILNLVQRMLQNNGYSVLVAGTPNEACALAEQYAGQIDLLLTDVVMPAMGGKDLHEQIKRMRPEIKTLFMSGYTASVVVGRGLVDEGIALLQKPFTLERLLRAVRNLLDG